MNDMSAVIAPKSDQLNADDLIAGPITITITKVVIKPGDQPVSIFFEGDRGKPYKCCKSMAKVMVACWGPDANEYAGRSMRLYRDPKVKWGGMEVGGIRISHMTNLKGDKAHQMALTETKGTKRMFTVEPLRDAPARTDAIAPALVQNVTQAPVAPEASPADRARAYADRFIARMKDCPSVEAFNDVMGSETVAKKLTDMKERFKPLWDEMEVAREDALKRLTATAPIPPRGSDIEDDEIPF